jgi:hypothetical protein
VTVRGHDAVGGGILPVAAVNVACHDESMWLLTSMRFPVLSLGALSLVAWLSTTPAPIESLPPTTADIVLSVEPIKHREQVHAHPLSLRHSVWTGTYVCAQGLASVTLTIDVDPKGVATARYDFGPTPSNPTIPKTGAFILVGSLQHHDGGAFTGELDARKWIVHPADYFMVPLSIASDDGVHMRGRIHHDSCSEFQAMRAE